MKNKNSGNRRLEKMETADLSLRFPWLMSIIKKFQGDLALVSQPFTESELKALKLLKKKGVLRRFSAIVRHRQIGLRANCMIVWQVPKASENKLGRLLASFPEVSHCYIRPAFSSFPYNLYSMTHGRDKRALLNFAKKTAILLKVRDYKLLWSVKELKKSSPVFA